MAEFYLKRKIDDFLEKWHCNPDRLPLIIRGPRQVGKTLSILNFCRKTYKSVIYINFVEEPQFKSIVSRGYSPQSIAQEISLRRDGARFIPGDTVIFFDEMQVFPEISTSLKFFKLDGRYDVICSGSMLGLGYHTIDSISVGYKDDYLMRSFDFEEYLWARGKADFIPNLLAKMISLTPFSAGEMEVFSSLYFEYTVLGGMPLIVRNFVQSGLFTDSLKNQQQLLLDYREDIAQYAEGLDKKRILNVFTHIPAQLAKENKKFQLSKLEKGASFNNYRGCCDWLSDAGVINICYCLNFPELPLSGNYIDNKFKIYFSDTGLLIASLDEESQLDLRSNRNLGVYKGAIYENLAADALAKQGYRLFYFKKDNSTLELDFLVRTPQYLVPIEVKATNGTAKSLRTVVESDKYPAIKFGIKFIKGNTGFNGKIYTFPYFCTFLLRRFLEHLDGTKLDPA